jgi:hypothetical protein
MLRISFESPHSRHGHLRRPIDMRVTLKAINDALAGLGENARLVKGEGYFYFDFGEAANWLDKTVSTPTLSSRTVEEWIEEFRRLKKLNQQLFAESDKMGNSSVKAAKRGRMKTR